MVVRRKEDRTEIKEIKGGMLAQGNEIFPQRLNNNAKNNDKRSTERKNRNRNRNTKVKNRQKMTRANVTKGGNS